MTRGVLTITNIARDTTGTLSETAGDVANGHSLVNDTDNRTFLFARNSGASTRTVTIGIPVEVDEEAVADKVVSIVAGATILIGPFPQTYYNQEDDTVWVDVSHTEVKLAAYKLVNA